MDLQERISILTQGVELAQKGGALTLDEAYLAKRAIDALKQNVAVKEAFEILIQTVTKGQKKGIYTLKDAHLLYLAVDGYEAVMPQPVQQPPVQQPAPTTAEPVQEKTVLTKKKKESE